MYTALIFIFCIAIANAVIELSETSGNVPITSCGTGAVSLNTVSISPNPPVPGKSVLISVAASTSEELTAGEWTLSAAYHGTTLLHQSGKLCDLQGVSCPIQQGNFNAELSLSIPFFAPHGSYDIKVLLNDASGAVLACGVASIDITKSYTDAVHDQELIEFVNSQQTSWKAGVSKKFAFSTMDEVKRLCGARAGGPDLEQKEFPDTFMTSLDIPSSFDSRVEWGNVCPSLHKVRDQGDCGSCWAVAAAAAITDRTCIQSGGKQQPWLASEDVLSCCGFFCGNGCDGGYPSSAWGYWKWNGLVTGGPYNSNQGCLPYEIPSCSHHDNGTLPACASAGLPTPQCKKTCSNGAMWSDDKHKGSKSYSVSSKVAEIQAEIMSNGPVEAAFTVYADFPSYKSGVYKHTTGAALGGHAVKIVGWGEENGTPYWTIANSWNDEWGNNGFFNILRGVDECGIESGIVAGLA